MKVNLFLFVLAVALCIPCYGALKAEEMDVTSRDEIPRLFPGFTSSTVAVIQLSQRKSQQEIENGNLQGADQFEALVFQRSPEGWVLANTRHKGLKVREDAIQRDILDHVHDIRIDSKTLISQQADETFLTARDLTIETGIGIQCKNAQGKDVAVLVLGKTTKADREGALDGYFVSRPDRPKEVILYEPQSKRWHMTLRSRDWLEMTIHEFALSNVESFYLKNVYGSAGFKIKPGSERTFVAIKEQCTIEKIDAPRQGEIDNVLQKFMKVVAEDFSREKIAADQSGAEVHVRVKLKTGEIYEVWVKPKQNAKEQLFPCASSESRFLFLWPDFAVNPFQVDPQKLFD